MFKLALNAGHGKHTQGKRCMKSLDKTETREWVLNSRICEKIESLLKEYVKKADFPSFFQRITKKYFKNQGFLLDILLEKWYSSKVTKKKLSASHL